MTQGLARRYGAWQLRDYAVERGTWTLLVGVALLAVFWLSYDPMPPTVLTDPPTPGSLSPAQAAGAAERRATELAHFAADEPRRFRSGVEFLFSVFGFVGTLIATHGIVSRDRDRGYYRFLFAKPVHMPAYYATAFAVAGAGLIAAAVVLWALTAAAFARAVPFAPVAVVATEFALLGGTVFLLSSLWRYDFVLAALSWPLAALAGAAARDPQGALRWLALLEPFLPPVLSLARFGEAITGPEVVRPADPAFVFGYGALCFCGGLYVLRRRAGARR